VLLPKGLCHFRILAPGLTMEGPERKDQQAKADRRGGIDGKSSVQDRVAQVDRVADAFEQASRRP